MVRINNTTATPPTEAALKELWDKQVSKLIQVRYPNYPESC
jgi:hypothetical protein